MCVCVYACIYEQKFIMAQIMRMRMFKMRLTSVSINLIRMFIGQFLKGNIKKN